MLLGVRRVSDGLNVTLTSLEDIPAQDISIAYDHINHNLNLHGAQGMTAELYSLVGNSLSSTRCTEPVTTISTGRAKFRDIFPKDFGINPIISLFIYHSLTSF
jgi:hypothetical protein